MASNQASKRESDEAPEDQEVPRVSKLAHQYESLAEKAKESGEEDGGIVRRETDEKGHREEEDIGKYRAQAQQKSMEAIRAAEQRYQKAKEENSDAQNGTKEESTQDSGQQGLGSITSYAAQKAAAAKDVIVSAGETAMHYIGEKAGEVKDKARHASKEAVSYAGEKAGVAKDVTVEKTVEAKDAVVETGWRAAEYTIRKAADASEATSNMGKRAAVYAGEKAEEAKVEGKRSSEIKNESSGEKWKDAAPDLKESFGMETMPTENIDAHRAQEESQGSQGGLLGAVGEALVEIVQNTKDMVLGKGPERKE